MSPKNCHHTLSFLEASQKWLDAAVKGDASAAAFQLQQLRMIGELLAKHADFDFHDGGRTPQQMLECTLHWLDAVARSHAACMPARSVVLSA